VGATPQTDNRGVALDIITRAQAKAVGLKRYFTGKPCKYGHLCEKYTSCLKCVECDKGDPETQAAYFRKWYAANKEKCRLKTRKYNAANPEAKRARKRNYKARKRGAVGAHTKNDTALIRKAQKDKCAYCRIKLKGGGHVDHIIALANGGTNWPENLQLTCGTCNNRKFTRCPLEFAREMGMLL
jgi:5-methylcytosine-specific restriction endonuclease McrA